MKTRAIRAYLTVQQAIEKARSDAVWSGSSLTDVQTFRLLLNIAASIQEALPDMDPLFGSTERVTVALQAFAEHMGRIAESDGNEAHD